MQQAHALRIGAATVVAAIGIGTAGSAGAVPPVLTSKIAYMSMRTGQADIYSMDANGGSQFNITHDGTVDVRMDVAPAWSPDGSLVAFERQYKQPGRGAAVMVVKADGTKLRTLSPPGALDGVRSSQPTWSPDGARVVFTSNRDGNYDLYAVNASGLGLKQLTFSTGPVRNFAPQWSPDGRTILFVRSGLAAIDKAKAHLYLLKLQTGAIVQLTRTPMDRGVGDHSPAWSPSGRHIAFASDRMGSNDIYVMSSDGNDIRRMTTKLSNDTHPTWAPAGQTLAFVSDRTGATEIFSFSAATKEPRQLTFDRAFKADPSWQRAAPGTVAQITN